MNPTIVQRDFGRVRRTWPGAKLSSSYQYLLLPNVRLPRQFNYSSTPLLIKLRPHSDYLPPESYVRRSLRVFGHRSRHLDEALTEYRMLERGWVKLCVQVNWSTSLGLIDYLAMALRFLEGLYE